METAKMDFKTGNRGFICLQKESITHKLFIFMKRDYPGVFQHIFTKYENIILRVGGGGILKKYGFFENYFHAVL